MSMWFGDYIDENVKNTNSSPIEWIKINIYNSKAKKNSPLFQNSEIGVEHKSTPSETNISTQRITQRIKSGCIRT